ncbi:MAG TPA: adhesin [Actinomycetota bacterium]
MSFEGANEAVVEPRKVRDYLLSSSHPVGQFKAKFFAALGYTPEAWGTLLADLRMHAVEGIASMEETAFGRKYTVSGPLRGPGGKEAQVVSVWIILTGEDAPRFVTAFPGARP